MRGKVVYLSSEGLICPDVSLQDSTTVPECAESRLVDDGSRMSGT